MSNHTTTMTDTMQSRSSTMRTTTDITPIRIRRRRTIVAAVLAAALAIGGLTLTDHGDDDTGAEIAMGSTWS